MNSKWTKCRSIFRTHLAYIFLTSFVTCLFVSQSSAQLSDRPDGMRFVPDVANQFQALTERPDPLGLRIGDSPNPSTCRHYQGMARVDGADGTPFFLVTRSGNTPFPPGEIGCNDSPGETRNGHLVVFRMGSRDKNGERLRSNRLQRGVHVDNTVASPQDVATIYYTVVGGDPNDPDPANWPGLVLGDGPGPLPPPRVYQHPGGMQVVGKMLAIGVESPRRFPFPDSICTLACVPFGGNPEVCQQCNEYEPASDPALIMFFDVSDPESPVFKSRFAPRLADGTPFVNAGAVGITPLPNGLYLMVVIGSNKSDFHFFRSTIPDLSSEHLDWVRVDAHPGPNESDDHQTLNFLREGNINGRLFLAGARGHIDLPFFSDRERIDLYEVTCASPECNPGEEVAMRRVHTGQQITAIPNTGGNKLLSLAAASGFYVSPTGELLFYATEHDNDGPNGTVKAGEWRHEDTVRPDSPLLLPTAQAGGPYEVDEGSSVSLTGSAAHPIAKPFLQLFHDTMFRSLNPIADYEDRAKDDFDDLFMLEHGDPFHHADKARSWNWYAPQGCSIRATDRRENLPDSIKTLTGASSVQRDADLATVLHDGGTDNIDLAIDRIEFLSDCDTYYSTPFSLHWDLNGDGVFETAGNMPVFSAANLDGPSVVNVAAQASHPSGGPIGYTSTVVSVRNVAPALTQFRVTDNAGNQVNSTVPFALTGLPITVGAGFTDPGVLDHQTAAIDWGDGVVESNTSFTMFDEAFGEGIGAASHTHTYNVAGSYLLALVVMDDDGGVDSESIIIRVVTPEQAVEEIIDLLDDIIAGTTDSNVRSDLEKARRALFGSNDHSMDGALNMIRARNTTAAISFLNQAIFWLRQAQANGADAAMLIALLEQVSAALSAA